MVQYDLGLDPDFDNGGQSQRDVPEEEEQQDDSNSNRRSNNEADDDLSLDEFLPRNSSLKLKTSIYEDADVIDEDDSHLSKFDAIEDQLRRTLIRHENNMTAKLHEEMNSMRNEPTDIHMVAVYYLVKCNGKNFWQSKAAILFVMLSFIVVGIQIILSAYLVQNIIVPTCYQDDDCHEGNYCSFEYNIYGDRITEHGNCFGECYFHNKFGRLHFPGQEWINFIQGVGCEDENDSLCIESISFSSLRNFCEDLDAPITMVKVFVSDLYIANRDVLDFMGVFILTIVGFLLVLNISVDTSTARKQLAYLQYHLPPTLSKQICITVIIASSTCLPFCAVQATVALMLGSPLLPQNIVLNALSIAFILEIDNIAGKFILRAIQIEEESLIQNFEYKKVQSNTVDVVTDYFIEGTCFLLFLYQILQVNRESVRFGLWLANLFGITATNSTSDLSCNGIFHDLSFTVGVVPGIFCTIKAFSAIFKSLNTKTKSCKVRWIIIWQILTTFSALFLFLFFTIVPSVLEGIAKLTPSYNIGTFYPTSMDERRTTLSYLCITSVSAFSIIAIFMWQLEKNLICQNDIKKTNISKDTRQNIPKEYFDENQYPFSKARKYFSRSFVSTMTKKQKIYVATIVISFSFITGLLGGLIPRKKNASCPFTEVEECSEFKEKYPECKVEKPMLIGDEKCNGGEYNTAECNYDNGDCLEFNANYPNCTVEFPYFIGDGYCHGEEYNTEECNWDSGDCLEVNEKYPDCYVHLELWSNMFGWCDEVTGNMVPQCGWDFGNCAPPESYLCMMDEDRVWDGKKCLDFNEVYPNCEVDDKSRIGDGICDEGEYNSEECNVDGGDCDYSNGFICMQNDYFTWDESLAVALEMNADLVKIECQEQNLRVVLLTNYTLAWIGLTDKDEEGRWTYSDGTGEINYENWDIGQPENEGAQEYVGGPDNRKGGDCAINFVSGGKPGAWHDVNCFDGFAAVYQSKSRIDGMNCVSYPQCPSN